ncbi:tyrosine-protein phosphatase 10D-like [Uloborus diversus]|uniref:tyrosine-protein phosphatase 10D-like n=1 Tax=Uloborus diversus TaxID=327109 RepID=UPI00240A4082|nr:tyrosine-protein phosphatase 10D-like [Uloborus diversus]
MDPDVTRSLRIHVDDACSDQSILLKKLRPEQPYTISVKTKVKGVVRTSLAANPQQECELNAGVPPVSKTSILRVKSGNGVKSLFIEWSQDTFSDAMGTLLKYAVLVGTSDAIGNLSSSGQGLEDVAIPTWKNFTDGFSDFYQATPVEWNPFERNTEVEDPLKCEVLETEEWPNHNITVLRCAVGLQEDCSGYEAYCNGPLEPDTSYAMKIRAFTRGGYADTHLLLARTGSYPKPSMGAGIIIGIIICLLILTFMAGIITYRKRRGMDPLVKVFETRFGNRTEPDAPLSLTLQEYQTKGKVSVEKFPEHVRVMMLDSQLKFSQEFEKLKHDSQQLPCTVAEMEENRAKNRWMNIFPFDHSRVKLLPLGDEPGSDFINANYIPGTSSLREYIATQGPLATTVDDFWRMIWEQSVSTIVMLTQCVERGKSKCEEYWPPPTQGGAHYGDLLVRTISVSMLDSYVIRIFRVQLGTRGREVKQLHFTRWPDFGCPESPEELLNFVRAVRDHLPRTQPGPIIVHCSAGVGRTGTFIAVDRIAQELQDTNYIDVYGTVMDLRQHRTNMVQTEDQYVYIHRCVLQLLLERNKPVGDKYEDVIYSNIGAHVSGV